MWIHALLCLNLFAPTLIKTGPRISPTTNADWAQHPDKHDYYTESWNAILKADDGHTIYLTFLYTNIGVMSGRSGVNISISPPNSTKAKSYQWEYDTEDFSDKKSTIKIKNNQFKLEGRDAEILIKEKNFKLNVKIKGQLNGVKIHSGKVILDKDKKEYVQTFFHVPRGDLEGTMLIDGRNYTLKGIAYIDHWAQNVLGGDYSTRWFNVRAFGKKHTFISLMWRYKESYGKGLKGWAMVADGSKVLAVTDQVKLHVKGSSKDPNGYRYANSLSIN
ncbi:hypothetical protein KKF91_09195, partial [Myxococcota bacterium]|nr:hypothetical protein [Myxococcota bacterium]